MLIDCAACRMQATAACDDCVVTHVLDREPGDALVLDLAEERALRAFAAVGLVPELRLAPRSGGGSP